MDKASFNMSLLEVHFNYSNFSNLVKAEPTALFRMCDAKAAEDPFATG